MYCPVCGSACGAPTALAVKTLAVAGKRLTYRLLLAAHAPRAFAVEIAEENGHCASASVGAELEGALAIYEMLSKNQVTVCHLAAVVHDLMYDPCAGR